MPLSSHLPALRRLIALSLALIAASQLPAAEAISATVLTAQGLSAAGDPRMSADTSLMVGALSVPLDQIVDLDVAAAHVGHIDQGVVLADGEVLRGVPGSLQGGKLQFASDLLGALSIEEPRLAVIVLGELPVDAPLEPSALAPGLVYANGESIAGHLQYLNGKEVGLGVANRIRRVPRERVRFLVLRPAVPADGTWVGLSSGDRLTGTLRGLADPGGISLVSPLGAFTGPMSSLRTLWCQSDRLHPLDRLTFTETHATTVIAIPSAQVGQIPAGASVPEGCRRGILSHAGSQLSFQDVAGWTALVGTVAAGAQAGSVQCSVLVDGKSVFDSGILAPGAPAKPFRVALGAAHALSLVTVGSGDLPGSALWRQPTLVK